MIIMIMIQDNKFFTTLVNKCQKMQKKVADPKSDMRRRFGTVRSWTVRLS